MRKMYLGYDLGDGETIANILVGDVNRTITGSIQETQMPSIKEAGKAIPTMYATDVESGEIIFANDIMGYPPEKVKDIVINFKRRPSSFLGSLSKERRALILDVFNKKESSWPTIKEAQNPELIEFLNKIVTFTNAIFTNDQFIAKLSIALQEVEVIEFCVGHPTKWDKLDKAIYYKILQQSILGEGKWQIENKSYKTELSMDAESRAAFLYCRLIYADKGWDSGAFRLLIDVGSSTIDVTAVSGKTANGAINDGDTNLGARIIDYLIFDWYLDELNKKGGIEQYNDIVKNNPTSHKILLFACRIAKESLFSTVGQAAYIMSEFPIMSLKRSEFEKLLDKPIKPILEKYLTVSSDYLNYVGNKNWKEVFEIFIRDVKIILDANKSKVSQVILTGSAANMPFIKEICKNIFGESSIVAMDIEPSKAISKGLTLVGQSSERSRAFKKDIDNFISQKLPEIIGNNIPDLANDLSGIITDVICDDIVIPELLNWKEGNTSTLKNAMDKIKSKCNESNIINNLQGNKRYNDALASWTKDKLIKSIDNDLEALVNQYGVIMDTTKISILAPSTDIKIPDGIEGIIAEKILTPAEVFAGILSVVAGIITFFVLPSVLAFVLALIIVIISYISVTIASIIFTILVAIPGPGYVLLALIGGVAVYELVMGGFDTMKERISGKIVEFDLPQWVRKIVKKEKLESTINEQKGKIRDEIKNGLTSDKAKNQIIEQLSKELASRVEEKAKEISYIIENN